MLFSLASLCWVLSLSIMYRIGGFVGCFYLFLCIIFFVITSPYLPQGCVWGVSGSGSCMVLWSFPPLRALFGPNLLYYLCHYNGNPVLVMLFLQFFSASFFSLVLYKFGMVLPSLPVGCYCVCCSPWHFSLYYCYGFWPLPLLVFWFVGSVCWGSMVSVFEGLYLRPNISVLYLVVEFILHSVDLCSFFLMVVGCCVPLCCGVWKYVALPRYCYKFSLGSAVVWYLPVVHGWKATEIGRRLHISWISVASSFEFWQSHPSFDPIWTHDVLEFAPCLTEVPFSSIHSGLSKWWQGCYSQLYFTVYVVPFLCPMVRGCTVSPIQPMASPLHSLIAPMTLSLYSPFFLVLWFNTFCLLYGLLCHGSVCVQVLPGIFLGLAALSCSGMLVVICSYNSSRSTCLFLPSLGLRQVFFTDCLRPWIIFCWSLLLYILDCNELAFFREILDCNFTLGVHFWRRCYDLSVMSTFIPTVTLLLGAAFRVMVLSVLSRLFFLISSSFLTSCSSVGILVPIWMGEHCFVLIWQFDYHN